MEDNVERRKCQQLGCTKEIFYTELEAREELERILTTQRKLSDIKPCRWYFSKSCNSWHLTSKPKITEY